MLLAGVIALPLQQPDGWQLLEYDKLPPHRVEFGEAGMRIAVDASASPIIYPLPAPAAVAGVAVSGRLEGLLDLPAGPQGEPGADDFSLRVGLVLAGGRRLNFFERMLSARWVRRLHDLAPAGGGIERVLFLNAVQDRRQLGRARVHPLSPLLHERNVWLLDRSGAFELQYEFETPLEVVALWLSLDGDDSRSRFVVLLEELRLETAAGMIPNRAGGDAQSSAGGAVERAR